MSPGIHFHPGSTRIARATYRRNELALRYASEPAPPERQGIQTDLDVRLGIRSPKWLCIADTLVLTFAGTHAQLMALDAYTNIDLWKRTTRLPLPEVIGTGSLCLATPPRDTDRVDLGVVPEYQYAESEARLRVTLGRPGIHHYRISTSLVVGIDEEGIATLDISDLLLEE